MYRGYFSVRLTDAFGYFAALQNVYPPYFDDIQDVCRSRLNESKTAGNGTAKIATLSQSDSEFANNNWDEDMARCEKLRERGGDFVVDYLSDRLRENGCVISINCSCCEYESSGRFLPTPPITVYTGEYPLRKLIGHITVCVNNSPNILRTMVHELIHANQFCRDFKGPPGQECYDSLRMEMEAYYCANQCTHDDNGNEITDPDILAIRCAKAAVRSACPRFCPTLGKDTIGRALSWFKERHANKELCKFKPDTRPTF